MALERPGVLLSFNFRKDLKNKISSVQIVEKPTKDPLLTFQEPFTQCKIQLIGVSHGSSASADLVRATITRVQPSVVVLELCDERYLSLCLQTHIKPNDNNSTMMDLYEEKYQEEIEKKKIRGEKRFGSSALAAVPLYFGFLKEQGLIIGSFVTTGMIASSLQKLMRRSVQVDEFTTAMQVAEEFHIPIRLGDARQSVTLKSVNQIISLDTINPIAIIHGAKSLAFSTFGTLFSFPDRVTRKAERDEEFRLSQAKCQWLSIPLVFWENKRMIVALFPLLIVSIITTLLGYLGHSGANADTAVWLSHAISHRTSLVMDTVPRSPIDYNSNLGSAFNVQFGLQAQFTDMLRSVSMPLQIHLHTVVAMLQSTIIQPLNSLPSATVTTASAPASNHWEWFGAYYREFLSAIQSLQSMVSSSTDFIFTLLLIRMAKIIGSDRDKIIASKVAAVCKEFPVSEFLFGLVSITSTDICM